ncbi:hypothetical protein [Halococcus sediminicola]|uniref:hypothetical protein n=1 Tax=Halococcus sediminicola TaxID=1264579 RepID=UPI00067999F1|nr:hypothetical protein [Halococcus sediminicola]
MNMIVSQVRVLVDESTVGHLIVFAIAGFGTLAIFGELAAVVGLSTLTLLLFWFIGTAVAVQSMFSVGGQVQPLIGGI